MKSTTTSKNALRSKREASHRSRKYLSLSVLSLALAGAVSLSVVDSAFAQSTTASIYGSVPGGEQGLSILVQSDSGFSRTVPVDASGRYSIGSLPIGVYTVTLRRGEEVIDTRRNIALRVNSGTDVSFSGAAGGATTLDAVTVTGASVPKIDVTATDSRTVITSEQLAVLPLARSAEAIALLAPGAVSGSGYFGEGNTVSLGGSGVSENAYYINGYNTGNPLNNVGGVGLPYGAIDQQEVYTGGYSARYGRSDGGVINQLGKRGTNEWHFGGQVVWAPRSLSSSPGDVWYPNATLPEDFGYTRPALAGQKYRSRNDDTSWNTVYSAYAGGPLIPDKLFVFLAAEQEKVEGVSTNSRANTIQGRNHYAYSLPKLYGKIDWNINDNNILEFTAIKSNDRRSGFYKAFDYDTETEGDFDGFYPDTTKVNNQYYIGKYTSYITDNLTFSATYGKSQQDDLLYNPGNSDNLAFINGVLNQDPSITGGNSITNAQSSSSQHAPDAQNKTRGLRLDLEYTLGDHKLAGGIDNMYYNAYNEGQSMTGLGYRWDYAKASDPTAAISPGLGVGAPGGEGYYVSKYILVTSTSMAVKQKAAFLEDNWQVNDNWLVTLGLRNDKFTNYNSAAQPYVESGNQWAPRLGFSWDAFGDSSLKVYGNLGRYYLALPNSVAIRGASASTFTREYFTYTGIDENGYPTGRNPLGPGPVSSNNEYGQTPDRLSITATDLKSMYQDELILGFDKTLGSKWTTGAKFTFRKLQSAIDDVCDLNDSFDEDGNMVTEGKVTHKLRSMGVDPNSVDIPGCVIFNPGETNTFNLANIDGSGRTQVTMSKQDWGFDTGAKRNYYALNLYLEHPFDGKWFGRVDYTWSRSYGNTEGQLKSDIGQTDVSKTQDWDAAALMWYSGGVLANDHRHQLKAYGSYQITPEWMVSGNLRVFSGAPKSCLGYWGTDESDPINYGSSYHSCAGTPSRPGDAGRTPWVELVDLGVTYRPNFADNKLAFGLQVFNALNQRKALQVDSVYEDDVRTVSNTYGMGLFYTDPRYVQLSVSYDY